VNCYLPYFRQWLITPLLSAIYFCRICLLKVCTEFNILLLLPYLGQWLVSRLLLFLFTYSHVHTLFGSFLPLSPTPTLSPHPPRFKADPVLPLSLILFKRRHKHDKEDKVFLLVKCSYTERFLALLPCTNMLQPKLIHL
jgi:hypothetical protein